MAGKHVCRAPGCWRARREWALTCKDCWGKVPADLKEALSCYSPGTPERRAAAREILRWFVKPQRPLKFDVGPPEW